MPRKFWSIAVALLFIVCIASMANAQGNGNQGDNPGNGNQGDNPGNGNQGDNPGNGNRGDNPGNGNRGENPGNGNQGDNPGNGNRRVTPNGNSSRRTPDGLTPAEEDTCDVLKGGTPGLYGLCIAFCEAHDCVPDLSAETMEERYRDCKKNDRKILEKYRDKKKDGDPDMPCLAAESACPCWGPQEIAKITGNSPTCFLDFGFEEDGCEVEIDQFYESAIDSDGTFRDIYYLLMDYPGDYCPEDAKPECEYAEFCVDGSCPPEGIEERISVYLTPEEYDACKEMMNQIGSANCY